MHEFEKMTDGFPLLPKTPLHENEFNYEKWDNGYCVVKLCNVPWDENYSNVVEFPTVRDRDIYLNGLNSYTLELQSGFRKQADEYIKIPVPIANAYQYNYVIIDYPIPPNSAHPLDYAQNEIYYRRELYFISRIDEVSPNTVRVYLQMDVWQMWRYSVDIKQLVMERGHVAIKSSADKDDYISNPISHTDWLLDSEPFTDLESVKNNAVYKPLSSENDFYMAVFSLPFAIDSQNIDDFKDKGYSESVAPTYEGNYIINKMMGVPTAEIYNVEANESSETAFYGAKTKYWYGVFSDTSITFFNTLKEKYKYILNNIEKIYLIQASFFETDLISNEDISFFSLTLQGSDDYITTSQILNDYASKVKYTKELIYPYAKIEITDCNGFSYELKTQDCSAEIDILNTVILSESVSIRSRISKTNGYAVDIFDARGYDNSTYSIDVLVDESNSLYVDFAIPTFAVYCRADVFDYYKSAGKRLIKQREIECAFDSAAETADLETGKEKALHLASKNIADASAQASYDNAIRSNATAYTNALQSNSTALDNALNSNQAALDNSLNGNTANYNNSIDSADTAYNNAIAKNAADYANAYDLLDAAYSNALASNANAESVGNAAANTEYGNATAANQTAYANALRLTATQTANSTEEQTLNSANSGIEQTYNSDMLGVENAKNLTSTQASNSLQNDLVQANQNTAIAQSVVSALSNVASANIQGAVFSSLSTAVGIVGDQNKANAIIANNNSMLGATMALDSASTGYANGVIADKTAAKNAYIANSVNNNVTAANDNAADSKTTADNIAASTNTTAININAANKATNDAIAATDYAKGTAVADRTKNTNDAIALSTQTVAYGNASRSKTANDANANRTKTANDANANRTKSTADSNALRNKSVSDTNARNTYDTALANNAARRTADDNASDAENGIRKFNLRNDVERDYDVNNYSFVEKSYEQPFMFSEFSYGATDAELRKGWTFIVHGLKSDSMNKIESYFDRYGYSCEYKIVYPDELQIMQKCTYWKAKDAIVIAKATEGKNANAIKTIIQNGVLVYDNPDNIGLLN